LPVPRRSSTCVGSGVPVGRPWTTMLDRLGASGNESKVSATVTGAFDATDARRVEDERASMPRGRSARAGRAAVPAGRFEGDLGLGHAASGACAVTVTSEISAAQL